MKETPKPTSFSMVFDKDRAVAMTVILTVLMKAKLFIERDPVYKKHEIDIKDFIMDDFGEKIHEFDWCPDPKCEFNKE